MELVDKHCECLKRISTPVISIGKRIPEFNRVRLWFDNNLADHFIRFLQGNGNHKRGFSRQNINEGGRNLVPRIWNNSTGLNNNPIKRRKMPK